MASPLIIRKGEGKKTIMIGPDAWSFRISGADVDGRFDLMEATITYLQGPPLHLHHEQDDTFFVIEGTLTVQVGDELFELHAGDVVCAPKGVPHTFANVGKEPVRVINIMTPGGFDRLMEDYASLPAGPRDPQVLEEFAQKHKIAFVGPSIQCVWALFDSRIGAGTLRRRNGGRIPHEARAAEFVEAEGQMTYGASIPETYWRSATYVDKILTGAKPADLRYSTREV